MCISDFRVLLVRKQGYIITPFSKTAKSHKKNLLLRPVCSLFSSECTKIYIYDDREVRNKQKKMSSASTVQVLPSDWSSGALPRLKTAKELRARHH